MSPSVRFQNWKSRLWIIPGLLIAGLSLIWLTLTPVGVTGKMQALGYAVCQQDPAHTLSLGGRLLPLCSRCTGMYLGALVGLAYLFKQGKANRYPSRGKLIVLALFFLAFLVDGVNSTLIAFSSGMKLYTPTNTLRLITGMGMGIVIANFLLPIWNQTFWAESVDRSVLSSWRQFGGLILLETFFAVVVLTGVKWLYFPVAILTTGMVPVLLTMIYTLLWMVIFKRENLVHSWREGIVYLEIGVLLSFVQIGIFDWGRFLLTGTWQGFHF
jgi:uncharacterized membrane protein